MKAVTFSSVTSEWKKEVVEDTSSVSGVTIKLTCTKAGTAGFHRNFYDLRSRIGATMTFSIDIKCSKSVTLNMGCELGGTKAYDVTTDWQRFVSSWKVSSYQYYSYIFYANVRFVVSRRCGLSSKCSIGRWQRCFSAWAFFK